MIDVFLAEKLIEKIIEYTDYTIHIMNEQGIVIGSCDRSRIGTFHEVAYKLISQKKNLIIVSKNNDYLGIQSGVNLPLLYKGQIVGAVDVNGVPEEVKPVALLIKMMIETIIQYEMKKESKKRQQDLESIFHQLLLYGDESDSKELTALSDQLHHWDDLYRVAILFRLNDDGDPSQLIKLVKGKGLSSVQDILIPIDHSYLLVFKHIPYSESSFFIDYQSLIREFVVKFSEMTGDSRCWNKCYVGSLQKQLVNLRLSYQHCKWLETNVDDSSDSIILLYDYADRYLRSHIPFMEMRQVFDCFQDRWTASFISNYVEVVGSLLRNNYNLVMTSKELFIHKNTLIFRLEKIKEELNMDPLHDIKARKFMNYLYYFFSSKNR